MAKGNGSILANNSQQSVIDDAPGIFSRLRYSPFLAQLVIIRRCNLSCSYCSEYDKVSDPIPVEILGQRLWKLKSLGTFGISLTGGEPTLHPQLPDLIRKCRQLGFFRTGMISNGFLLRPELIKALNEAGLQEMQISIDGVEANDATQKVLSNLKKRLQWLREHARFRVVVSGVLGACPPHEAEEVLSFARQMGFIPRVLLLHDSNGQLKPSHGEVKTFEKIWCSQTRSVWSKSLMDYTRTDLREQFYQYKPCHATCTLGCARSTSQLDNWRTQPGFNS